MGHVPILLLKFLGDQLGRDTVHIVVDVYCTPFGSDRTPVPSGPRLTIKVVPAEQLMSECCS